MGGGGDDSVIMPAGRGGVGSVFEELAAPPLIPSFMISDIDIGSLTLALASGSGSGVFVTDEPLLSWLGRLALFFSVFLGIRTVARGAGPVGSS